MEFARRKTRPIQVGAVAVGGGSAVSVQSMCTTKTKDVDATVRQISELVIAGCDIIRVGVPGKTDAEALPEIVRRSPIPVVADIHFSSQLVIAAIEAGCGGVRVNPGNIRNFEKVARDLISAARSHGVSLRIGVNAGSLDPDILAKYQAKTAQIRVTADMLVESALKEARLFEQYDFSDFKISLKHHDPLIVIEAYRKLAELGDWPLHLGVTEAGLKDVGIIKSVSALSVLLSEGIGDTIRISLTDDPIEEVKAGTKLLEVLGLRTKTLDIVSCPTCARTNLNVIELTKRVEAALKGVKAPLTVAVMGCEVNGPGEAREADVGIAAGNGIGHLFVKGQIVKSVPESEIVEVLVAEVQKLADSK